MKERWIRFRDGIGGTLSPFLFSVSLFLLDFGFRFFHRFAASTVSFPWRASAFTMFWVLIFGAVVCLLPGFLKKAAMAILYAGTFVLVVAHSIIYHVTGSFLLFSDLAFAEDGLSFMSLSYLGIGWGTYLSLIFCTALCVVAILTAPKKASFHPILIAASCIVIAAAVSGIRAIHTANVIDEESSQFRWTDTYDPASERAYYTEMVNANECLLFCGNYQYVARCLEVSLRDHVRTEAMREELDEYYASHIKEPESNEKTGVFAGKNVICFLLESIDTWMLTEDYMPNLYALQQESINFENHFTPLFLSAGTFNTEFALNCGFYLPVTGTGARTYATNVYPQSLPNLFRSAGYTANSYHTLDGRFYNRENVHPVWGYESYNDHNVLHSEGYLSRDTTLMEEYSYSQIVHDEPFCSYVICYSGHGPYTDSDASNIISEPHLPAAVAAAADSGVFTENENTYSQYEYAIAHAMETDAMVGLLLDRLEEDGHIDDTVLVFLTDHYSKYLTDFDFVLKLKGAEDENMVCRTPFFIYSKGYGAESVTKVTASADMLPTIANLFGIPYDPTYLIGNDAFGDRGGYVAFKDYSWYDGTTYWTPDYDGETTDEIRARCKEVYQLLNASWDTVKCNYFAYHSEKQTAS